MRGIFKKLVLLIIVGFGIVSAADRNPPCKMPPFLGKSAVIPPHIIMVIDYSGSMSWLPQGFPKSYNSSYPYSGPFEKDKMYYYNTSRNYFEPVGDYSGGPEVDINAKAIRGNILNWVAGLIRITILKYVLQGDEKYIVSGPDANGMVVVDIIKRNYKKYYYFWQGGTKYRLYIRYKYGNCRRDGYTGNPCIGGKVYIKLQKRVRKCYWWWCYWKWEDVGWWANGKPARLQKPYLKSRGLIASIQDKDADGVVDPDAPTWSVVTYQGSRAKIRIRKSKDITAIRNALDATYATGGTPTRYGVQVGINLVKANTHNPSNDVYYEYINGTPMGLWCKNVYSIVLTDGDWNTGGEPIGYVYNSHRYDQRRDLPNEQRIIYFTMFMFGSGRGRYSQRWLAVYGGFNDVDNNRCPGSYSCSPPYSKSRFYARTRPIDYQEWDEDGNHEPDNYFEVYNAEEMEQAFNAIFQKIKVGVASSAAAPSTPQTVKGTGMVIRAVYFPVVRDSATQMDRFWFGDIQTLFVDENGNLREDTDDDNELDYRDDRVVVFYYRASDQQVMAALYRDANGDGLIQGAETIPVATDVPMSRIHFIMKASDWLNSHSPNARRIFYHNNSRRLVRMNHAHSSELKRHMGEGISTAKADTIMDYIKGRDFPEIYRVRSINGRVWKLGDIMHSTPAYISTPMERYDLLYKDNSYKDYYRRYFNSRGIIIVGANDGMLHAFNAGVYEEALGSSGGRLYNRLRGYEIGEEVWGIVPYNLLPHLQWMLRRDYEVCHVYYVDGKPKVTDLRIFAPSATHPNGWGTVLAVGFGFGGDTFTISGRVYRSAYLVLDVTDPVNPAVLMEFTDPGLGFTTGYPAFIKVGNRWFMVVGSGPNKLSGESDQRATLYVIGNLASGGTIYKFQTFSNNYNAFIGNPVGVDMNLDFNVDFIYFGVNYYDGSKWRGQLYKLITNGDENPNNWSLVRLASVDGPITAQPSIALDEKNNLWVFFGTGKYFGMADATDSSVNYIYGIKDKNRAVNYIVDVTNVAVFVDSMGRDSVHFRSMTMNFKALEDTVERADGWRVRLNPGEKVLEKAAVVGGMVLVPTFMATGTSGGNPCDVGNAAFGSGRLFALYYKTGTAHPKGYLEKTASGQVLSSVTVEGMPSTPEVRKTSEGKVKIIVQSSLGTTQTFDIKLPFSIKSGVKLWKGLF